MSENKKMVEAITPINEDFTQWYTDVCLKAELVDTMTMCGAHTLDEITEEKVYIDK